MIKSSVTTTGTAILVLMGLTGCATYEKCGIGGCAGDHKITADVRAALDEHPELNSINVETLDHVVYLTGRVSEGEMRLSADSVAQRVAGVSRVVDTVYVTK
jgi:osmotically-inducible protein OsmY